MLDDGCCILDTRYSILDAVARVTGDEKSAFLQIFDFLRQNLNVQKELYKQKRSVSALMAM